MQDRKNEILLAGLETLREQGLAGFTQPRVAARASLRQSHLTYYFPTRVDLLAAVARIAIDNQLAAFDAMLAGASGPQTAAIMAGVMARHDNTRVLMAMAQAADQEPALRELFRELTDGILARLEALFEKLDVPASEANRDLVHALSVGLSVIDLATSRPAGEARAKAVLDAAFAMLSKERP